MHSPLVFLKKLNRFSDNILVIILLFIMIPHFLQFVNINVPFLNIILTKLNKKNTDMLTVKKSELLYEDIKIAPML